MTATQWTLWIMLFWLWAILVVHYIKAYREWRNWDTQRRDQLYRKLPPGVRAPDGSR